MTDDELARIDRALNPFFRWCFFGWVFGLSMTITFIIGLPFFVGPGRDAEPHMRALIAASVPEAHDVYVSCSLHNADETGRHFCFANYALSSGKRTRVTAQCSPDPTCMAPCIVSKK